MLSITPNVAIETHLLQQAQLDDQDAITRIYETYYSSIYKFVRMRVDDTQQSEDITGDVFCRFIDTIGKQQGPQQSLRGWLYEVARNEIYRYYAIKQKSPLSALNDWLTDPSDAGLEIQVIHTNEIERAQRGIRMLVPEQREVLTHRFVEMLSLEETAQAMKKSTSAIKSLQLRAVTTIRKLLRTA